MSMVMDECIEQESFVDKGSSVVRKSLYATT
jgi:hypothetical protein